MSFWDNPGETQSADERGGILRGLMSSPILARSNFFNWAGVTFRGMRDLYRALGYARVITPMMYRWRYDRGGIVGRLVEAKPQATWREGGTIIEDEDPDTETTFEKAWFDLDQKFRIWPLFEQADILAGLGKFSIILIGGGGKLDLPLTTLAPTGLLYLSAYSERDVIIESLDTNDQSPRFGLPVMYNCARLTSSLATGVQPLKGRVHYTRVIHIADNVLDERIYGQPRQERIWNHLDDLDKIVGGGAEAFWKRIDAGMQLKLDPNIADMKPDEKAKLDEQLDEYTNGLRRILKTRGIDINQLSSQISGLKDPVDTVIALISAATGIPQRILMGSERGELASSQDRDEWGERIGDRRTSFAGPAVVRPFIDRMIELGVLPQPKSYEPRWPGSKALDDVQKVTLAKELALANQAQGEIIVTTNEIRDRYLDLPPIEEVLTPEELAARNAPPPAPVPPIPRAMPPGLPPPTFPTAARRAAKWNVLKTSEKLRYLARHSTTVTPRPRTTVTEVPIPSEERALVASIATALTAEDKALAERIIANALAGLQEPRQLPAAPVERVAPVTIHTGSEGRVKRIEYQKVDGIMRPHRIIEEPVKTTAE